MVLGNGGSGQRFVSANGLNIAAAWLKGMGTPRRGGLILDRGRRWG